MCAESVGCQAVDEASARRGAAMSCTCSSRRYVCCRSCTQHARHGAAAARSCSCILAPSGGSSGAAAAAATSFSTCPPGAGCWRRIVESAAGEVSERDGERASEDGAGECARVQTARRACLRRAALPRGQRRQHPSGCPATPRRSARRRMLGRRQYP